MHFRLYPLRFSFLAQESLHFPAGKSSNILRGAFGSIFRRIACHAQCAAASLCSERATCPYARLFEPTAPASGLVPSGLTNWPRPFVFRASHLDGRTLTPGEEFYFDLHLFDSLTTRETIDCFKRSFVELGAEGLGPARGKAELLKVLPLGNPDLTLDLSPSPDPVSCLRIEFLTPTELKSGDRLATVPEFVTLASRARDRISTLRQLYSTEGALPIDFRAFSEKAALVRLTHCNVRTVEVERRSSRTSQSHSIGGFVGEATYEGPDLNELAPLLMAAQWTGVGRHTVWGNGEIRVSWSS